MVTTKQQKPELSDTRVSAKEPKDLIVNDTFIILYGYDFMKCRVHKKLVDGVWAHSVNWMKSSSMFFSNDDLVKRGFRYYGRISKLRAFFMW